MDLARVLWVCQVFACVMTALRACGALRCVWCVRAMRAVNIHDVQVVCMTICE